MSNTPKIHRLDRYTISINGHSIRATEEQERQIREMNADEVARLLKIMGHS